MCTFDAGVEVAWFVFGLYFVFVHAMTQLKV